MSIFNNDTKDIAKLDENIIDKFYELEWDWIDGTRVKRKIQLKMIDGVTPEYKQQYYFPNWVFTHAFNNAVALVRREAKSINKRLKVDIKLSRLEVSNIRFRFNNLIKDCTRFEYKGDSLIYLDYTYNRDSVIEQINEMMCNYIKKETANIKYFLREK